MEKFTDSSRNQINIAILGAVSAGKSTLVNTIFAETFSKCKIKRTTMTPQIYLETDAAKTETANEINEKNTEINNKLIAKTQAGETVTLDDIKETVYLVPKVHDFTELEKDIYLTIYDIPGLNDGRTKDVYFEYIENNFNKFDIVIFVVDINSALNTSDEVDILVKIVENCKVNSEKHGIHNKLVILANKCDEMSLSSKGKPKLEEEHQEMMDQLQSLVKEKVDSIFPSLDYKIKPLSSEDSYIYRMYDRNKDTKGFELDMKYLNKFGYNEYGKTRWNKLTEQQRRNKINKLLVEIDMDETMNITGFNGFRKVLNKFLSPINQKIYINNHILQGLAKIVGNTKIDISADIQLFYKFLQQYKSLEKRINVGIDTAEIFSTIFSKYLDEWDKNILMGFIDKKSCPDSWEHSLWNLKEDTFLPQIEEAKVILDNAVRLFNGDVEVLTNLNNKVTSALNNYYVKDIESKVKPVDSLFGHLNKLVMYGYRITKDLISNLFSNPDMINKKPQEIIDYLEKLESDGFIDSKEKVEKVLEILKTIYTHLYKTLGNKHLTAVQIMGYMPNSNIHLYTYYVDMFWTKYINTVCLIGNNIDRIGYICRANQLKYMTAYTGSTNNAVEEINKDDLIILENYYISLMSIKAPSVDKPINTVKKSSSGLSLNSLFGGSFLGNTTTNMDDTGSISDELDEELGIVSGTKSIKIKKGKGKKKK